MIENQLGEWKPILKEEFNKPYMRYISLQLDRAENLCPSVENIFKAYELTAPNKVKVVMLGLEPDHHVGSAHGLSYSTLGSKLPPSLRVIFNELVDSGLSTVRRSNKDLSDWAAQGVLMLNSILTTKQGQTLAHGTWGWQELTGKTIEYLMNSDQLVVYLAWGKAAQKLIDEKFVHNNNVVLKACHPAAQLYGGAQSFIGNRHFVKTNYLLHERGLTPIVWDTSS
jgi:uracil-DNA glycosylase